MSSTYIMCMKYHCKECDFEAEGESKIIHDILEHEKTHPQPEMEMKDDGTKPPCSFCGCKVDHNIHDITAEDLVGLPFKHITYGESNDIIQENNVS